MARMTRAEIEATIEEEYSTELLGFATESSTVLNAFRTKNMGHKVSNMPALATRPEASWVGETAATRTKPTTTFSFESKQLVAAETAAIIVLNEEDLEDASEDLLNDAARLGGEAIGRNLDRTVLFGTNKPALWTSPALVPAAIAAGNVFEVGAGADDLVGSILQAAGAVDDSGADPDTFLARRGLKYTLQNLRDGNNNPLLAQALNGTPNAVDTVAGLDTRWNGNGAWDRAAALGIVANSQSIIIGVRSDISVKFLDQATIEGVNLAENDQIALRFRARYAYVIADTVNGEGTRISPISIVRNPAPAAV